MLNDNNGTLPAFNYNLLVNSLKLSNDSSSHVLPLLFKSARYKNSLTGFHPFYNMFEAMDRCKHKCAFEVGWTGKPNLPTIMTLPVAEIFDIIDEDDEELSFMSKESIKESKVQVFLQISLQQGQLKFKEKKECKKPNILGKLQRAFDNGQIIYKQFIDEVNLDGDVDFSLFINKLIYQNQSMLQLHNRDIRSIMMNMTNMNVGYQFNNKICKIKWKSFYKQNMHYSARNLWYKMMHHQSSNRSALYTRRLKDIEDDKCLLCNEVEDAKHLLISCNHKLDVWGASFKKFLGYPTTAIPQQIYQSIMHLNLKQYFIYNLDIKITIYDLFATIMRMIWKYHYLQLYQNVPFDHNIICKDINTEVMRLSSLMNIYM